MWSMKIALRALSLPRSRHVPKALPLTTSDDLVAHERQRVLTASPLEDMLILQNITKQYGRQCSKTRHLAVNQLCLGMQSGEVSVFMC